MILLENIINNYNYFRSDFSGFTFNFTSIFSFFLTFFLAIFCFFLMYLVGEKILVNYFKNEIKSEYRAFISVALGYIFIGTSIALLGVFSLFYTPILISFLFLTLFLTVYPFSSSIASIKYLQSLIKIYKLDFSNHKILYLAIFSFVLINFLRLILPETNVDALWYHTDLPHTYKTYHSLMVKPNYQLHLIAVPQLSEMYYVIAEFFHLKNASRIISFLFYILIVLFLIFINIKIKTKRWTLYAALLFVTAPVVIRHASSALANFQWIFCWLLAIILLIRNRNLNAPVTALSAILFGGVLATKIWMLIFLPLFPMYLLILNKINAKTFKQIIFFLFFSILVPLLWYLRAYILTGNPVYPALSKDEWFYPQLPSLEYFVSLEAIKFRVFSIFNFSPLFFLAVIFFFIRKKSNILVKPQGLILFFIIISSVYVVTLYYFGHYLYPWYVIAVILFSVGIKNFISLHGIFKYLFAGFFFLLFSYYFLNTLFALPYGLGVSDENKYLTRIISRDNSSYYDYDHRFSQKLKKNDYVASYGLWGFYYANFDYIFVVDIFRKKGSSLNVIKESGATKLLIKGGDIDWFCKKLQVKNCSNEKYELLASYPYNPAFQYLYKLR